MIRIRRLYRWLIVCVGLLVLLPWPASAQTAAPDSASDDLRGYATYFNLSLDEAARRFALQDAARPLQEALSTSEAATFGGLWLEHTPAFRVVVAFTGDGERTIAPYLTSRELAAVVDVRTVRTALADLERDQDAAVQSIRQAGFTVDSRLAVKANRVQILTVDADALELARREGRIQLADTVQIVPVEALSEPAAASIYAGIPIWLCTSGFSVKDTNGTRGILTAGHCNNSQAYSGYSLPFKKQLYSTYYDVQWHTAPMFAVTNKAVGKGGALRNIYYTWSRSSQLIDEVVCKYGVVTLYTCGWISDKDFVASYVPSATSTYILVESMAGPMGAKGDSGGPVYSGSYAYGVMEAITTIDEVHYGVYMAINYATSGLAVGVLTTP